MRICFLADGQSIHTKRWCDHFSALGHEIHLITLRKTEISSAIVHLVDGGDISVKGGNWRVLFKAGSVKRLIRKINPDILHAHYATSYGILGALSGFHPFVVTALGTDVLISPVNSKPYRWLLSYVFKRADWITAMADHMKEVMVDLGFPERKISVVPFGIDQNIFFPPPSPPDDTEFVICSTRNFEPVYNIPLLLNAVAGIKDSLGEFKLILIGDGSLRKEFESMVEELGLSKNTEFRGRIQQPLIAEQLRNSHLFVTTSLSDGNNISLNEAMACGVIPVATRIPANTQWINDGKNGFLVGVNDVELLADIILKARKDYYALREKFFQVNQVIIREKASWQNNMSIVEQKYKLLCNT